MRAYMCLRDVCACMQASMCHASPPSRPHPLPHSLCPVPPPFHSALCPPLPFTQPCAASLAHSILVHVYYCHSAFTQLTRSHTHLHTHMYTCTHTHRHTCKHMTHSLPHTLPLASSPPPALLSDGQLADQRVVQARDLQPPPAPHTAATATTTTAACTAATATTTAAAAAGLRL